MSKKQRFLGLDLGAGCVKAAEFEIDHAEMLWLRRFRLKSLGQEGAQESKREKVVETATRDLFAYRGFSARRGNACAPGFLVFSKFIKLPPVDTARVRQIIQYEAQQNIPYPIEEAVWDFQILGNSAAGDVEVFLASMKAGAVEGIFRSADGANVRLDVVDVSGAALANAFRYNYGDPQECVMLLDIGARTSNVLLFEKGRVFARSINIGGNAITQDFVAESKLPWAKAEELKVTDGFVGLGGAYEEPESAQQAAISKIARQVLTRLHIQVNQTVQFWRGQMGGSAPVRIYLAGGAASMAYTPEFFTEKFDVPVEYFNPLRNVGIDEEVDRGELGKVAHCLGEVVGVALRNLAECPVELNLIPKSVRSKQLFAQKKPYLLATFLSVVAVVFAIGLFYQHLIGVKQHAMAELKVRLAPLEKRAQEMDQQERLIKAAYTEANLMTAQVRDRFFWPEALVEMRKLLMNVEGRLSKPGHDIGVWIENFGTVDPGNVEEELTPQQQAPFGSIEWMKQNPEMAERYFRDLYRMLVQSGVIKPNERAVMLKGPVANTNLFTINVKFRAVTPTLPNDPAANGRIAYAVAEEFKKCPYFDPEGTKLSSDMEEAEALTPLASTFRFNMVLKLHNELQM